MVSPAGRQQDALRNLDLRSRKHGLLKNALHHGGVRNKQELGGIWISALEAEERLLHDLHLVNFLLVTILNGWSRDFSKCLRDDGNEQVEEDNQIEDGGEEEDNPITFTEEL